MARKTSWADEELEGIDLGDERRNDRAKRVLMRFAEKPTQSIVGATMPRQSVGRNTAAPPHCSRPNA
ncbi:IS4/Tn5 family transposase DNA-binding protein [Paraburkholderia aspalathi]|uniref:IS4/Tn5 family transposase DNA-binding protein n=1 Tax=Paraburkholderia aspalathi TaxID=1324617 RepID=UPI00190C9DB3|nr:transposase DNA-binding-containing protein [Paraburkholderia aspalathi]MBK3823489.1 hypothetical protein [Paraburkholderia aspalathi]MBK3835319.1 hypothetical protein [Paraburkholderia aspalathi]MBK3865075.1 hypothetical protein [Paraburkholderia aspalathi]